MVDFPSAVSAPGGASYSAPLLSFAAFSRWKPDDPYAQVFKQQQEEENAQKLQSMQRQNALAGAFPNGLPTDANGQVDYRKLASVLASKGDIGDATKVLSSQPAPLSPLFGGGPAPAASAQPSPSTDATAAKIIQNESGGNPNAKNPNSSAAGLGQFTDSTWIDAVKRYFPNLAKGRSDDQILKMRAIPQLATRVTEAFTAGNEDGLQRAGLPVTPATAYLAHFAGLDGATKVLRADPNTPVSQILGSAAIKANPFLKGMTARDLERWAARKMTGPAMVAQQGQSGGDVQTADASPELLPPSVNAVSPRASSTPAGAGGGTAGAAPAPSAVPSPAPAGAGAPQPQPMAQTQPSTAPAQQPAPVPHPLVPQEPLPPGYTDPVLAAHYLRMEAAREAADPRPGAAAQAKYLSDWANRIDAGLKPITLGPGKELVDPRSGRTLAQGTPGNAANLALQRFLQVNPNATPEQIQAFVQSGRSVRSAPAMAVQAFQRDFEAQHGRAPSADEIAKFAMDYSRQQSYGRAAGTQGARVENAANEVVQLIPQAVEASRALPRGRWVPINQLVQKWDQGTSDPAYNDFMMANFSLLNAYTRAMNPQGTPRIQERLEQHALGVLSMATSQKAYEVQVRRLWKEVQASKKATAETAKGTTPGDINAPVPGLDNAGTKAQGTTSSGLKWSVE